MRKGATQVRGKEGRDALIKQQYEGEPCICCGKTMTIAKNADTPVWSNFYDDVVCQHCTKEKW